ncbi:sulfatase [Mahella australiensis 50-1 BON]|uniref:Sulfatase n=2 Tax=Mahella TaxID=252965 RepID=F3ZW27_MAHA5|nr:sulfatase [Mahella australiensis 50-1 BON]
MNILFIMADQWRADCLSCAGHPVVKTPSLDKLAQKGVRFESTYVQWPVCGPSRTCLYTGRYMHAHRSTWNGVPLPEDERSIGHYFTSNGYDAVLIGKGHYSADDERLPQLIRCGFDPERDRLNDGGMDVLATEGWDYGKFLMSKGYISDDPIDDFAMTVKTPQGENISAWDFKACPYPLRVKAEDSPPAYLTDKAMEFMRSHEQRPWIMHLSYTYPHWPIAAPAPYNALYDPAQVPRPCRNQDELKHPIMEPFRKERRSLPFDNRWVWQHMRATYYGMMSLVDMQLGRLFDYMEQHGLMDNTMIVFTSDHGEYLGDHWLFEKELFYEQAVRVPLIVYCPGGEYDVSRGSINYDFVQSIDLLPSMMEEADIPIDHRIQGKSLMGLLRGRKPEAWQSAVYADWDYEFYHTGEVLGIPPERRRAWMVRDHRFKYVHFLDLPDMLFDMENDSEELHNLADNPFYKGVVETYRLKLLDWRMSTEDRSRSGWFYNKYGAIGVSLPSDKFANYGLWKSEDGNML